MKIKRISKEPTGRVRKSRIYFWAEKIHDLFKQKFEDERMNPKAYRQLLPDVFKEMGLPEATKARWRSNVDPKERSAAFILDDVGYDIHVIVS